MDDSIRVIVVTGKGKAFCAGADLNVGDFSTDSKTSRFRNEKDHPRDSESYRDDGGITTTTINQCRKVVIGAINGTAVGIGITMVWTNSTSDVLAYSDLVRLHSIIARSIDSRNGYSLCVQGFSYRLRLHATRSRPRSRIHLLPPQARRPLPRHVPRSLGCRDQSFGSEVGFVVERYS